MIFERIFILKDIIRMKSKDKFTTIIILFLSLLFGTFTGILTLAGFFWINRYPLDFTEGFVDTFHDSPLLNLLTTAIVCILAYLIIFLFKKIKKQEMIVHLISAVFTFLMLAFLILFVYKCKCEPVCDQMQLVLDAIFFKNGNYEDMLGYMRTYQHQYGLVFLEEMVMRIKEDWRIFQYLNAFFVSGGIYAMYRITRELFQKPVVSLVSVLFAVMFVPLYFYTNFVYGEVPSLAFGMYGIWLVILFLKKREKRFINKKNWFYLVGAVILLTLSYLARTNMIILLTALALAVCVYAIREKRYPALICAVLFLIVPILVNTGVKKSYELRSGYSIGSSEPTLARIAMGMQPSEMGYGFFNGYADFIFNTTAAYDTEVANQIYKEEIAYRLDGFKTEPRSAYVFYKLKMMQQWNEGTFGSIVSTNAFIDSQPGENVRKLYSAEYGKYINAFCNRYVAVVYFMFFAYAVFRIIRLIKSLIQKKEEEWSVEFDYLLMIYFIGGFLFSLLWEAKPRYVFPYVYVCLPLAAMGLYQISEKAEAAISKISKKKNKEGKDE